MDIDLPNDVLVVEDDLRFARHLCKVIKGLDPPARPWHCGNGRSALEMIAQPDFTPLFALIDIGLPDMSGIEVIRALKQRHHTMPSLVLSVFYQGDKVVEAIKAGASGYLLKAEPVNAIEHGIKQVLAGNCIISPVLARHLFKLVSQQAPRETTPLIKLTSREEETLKHIGMGASYLEAAQRMGVSLSTVQSHIRTLYRKLGANSRTTAINKAQQTGLL